MARKRSYDAYAQDDYGIYDKSNAQEQCEDDIISGAEEGFMIGYLQA